MLLIVTLLLCYVVVCGSCLCFMVVFVLWLMLCCVVLWLFVVYVIGYANVGADDVFVGVVYVDVGVGVVVGVVVVVDLVFGGCGLGF
jgi:hypothetical protein